MVGAAQKRDPVLDLLRSWAIIHVILFHVLHALLRFMPEAGLPGFLQTYPAWLNFTWQPMGVDVIFVVSAYLLMQGLLAEQARDGRINHKRYFIRRVSRIIPLYWIAVLLFGIIQQSDPVDVILALLFVEFLITGKAVVPVGWSMEVMMLVYIALPAVAAGLTRTARPVLWIGAAIALSLGIRIIPLWDAPEVATTLFTHLLEREEVYPQANALYFAPWFRLTPFLIGIGLAAVLHFHPALFARLGRWRIALFGIAALLIYAALFLPIHDPTSWIYQATTPPFWMVYWASNGALFALATALIIIAGHGAAPTLPGPWASISRNIMGIYLFHMPMILIGAVVVFQSTDEAALATATYGHVLGIFGVALVLSLGVAAVLNRFVEGPIQKRLRQRFDV